MGLLFILQFLIGGVRVEIGVWYVKILVLGGDIGLSDGFEELGDLPLDDRINRHL